MREVFIERKSSREVAVIKVAATTVELLLVLMAYALAVVLFAFTRCICETVYSPPSCGGNFSRLHSEIQSDCIILRVSFFSRNLSQ